MWTQPGKRRAANAALPSCLGCLPAGLPALERYALHTHPPTPLPSAAGWRRCWLSCRAGQLTTPLSPGTLRPARTAPAACSGRAPGPAACLVRSPRGAGCSGGCRQGVHALSSLFLACIRRLHATSTLLPAGPQPTRVLAIELVGDRFLRRMVRVLVATAVREAVPGAGWFAAPDAADGSGGGGESGPDGALLRAAAARDRRATAPSAPAEGLCFLEAGYRPLPEPAG